MNLGFRACFGIGKHSPERYPPQRGGLIRIVYSLIRPNLNLGSIVARNLLLSCDAPVA